MAVALGLVRRARRDPQQVQLLRRLELGLVPLEPGAGLRRRDALLARLLGDVLAGEQALARLVGERLLGLARLGQLLIENGASPARLVGERVGGALHFPLAPLDAALPRPLPPPPPVDEP